MPRWGMVIDLNKCAACQACVVACQVENNVPYTDENAQNNARGIFWNKVLVNVEGEYPDAKITYTPTGCMQCDKPPCVKECPTGASYKNDEGVVLINYQACIGCRICMEKCPYGARSFNWTKPKWDSPADKALNPDPETKPREMGVVEKCTFCIQRIRKAKEKALGRKLRDGEVEPACVQTCPPGARVFGDLDDPNSRVSKLAKGPRAFRFREELGTEPKVYYLKEKKEAK